jgi:hypothetical protein
VYYGKVYTVKNEYFQGVYRHPLVFRLQLKIFAAGHFSGQKPQMGGGYMPDNFFYELRARARKL